MTVRTEEIPVAPQKIARLPYLGPALVVTSLLLIGLLLAVEKWLPHRGFMQELTVGGGAIADADKLRDMRLAPMAIGAQLALLLALTLGRFNLSRIGIACFGLLTAGVAYHLLLVVPNNMPLLLFCALALTAGASYRVSQSHWQEVSGQIILMATGAVLVVHHLLDASPTWAFVLALPVASAIVLLSGPTVTLWAASAGAVVVAIVVVLSAPVFWFDGPASSVSLLDGVHALVALAVLAQTGWTLRHTKRQRNAVVGLPSLGVALAILLLIAPGVWSPVIPVDDYHFGERLLAARALFIEGGWFANFLSPHGLSDASGSVIAWLQGDLTGAGIVIGGQIFKWYGAALLVWLLVNRLGPVAAAGFALVLPIWWSDQVFFLMLNLVLAVEVMALRRAGFAGALGVTVAAGGVFFNAGLGAAAAVVAAAAGLILHWQRGRRDLLLFTASGAVTGFLLIALFWTEVVGMLDFLRVSAATNLTIYGNGDVSVILQNPRHFLYILAPLLAVALAGGMWAFAQEDRMTNRVGLLVALIAPSTIFALVLNQYAAARLDGQGTRGLIVSSGLLVFLPVWLSLLQDRRRIPLAVSATCILLVLPVTQGATNLRASLLPPAPLGPRDEIAEDIPYLGTGTADPVHLAMLREVHEVVDTILDPGETFLNFTNRNSLYFYFDRHNPVAVASAYNAAPEAFQRSFLAALGDTPPPLALIQIENYDWDGLSLPLRSHHLYAFLIRNYHPFVRSNHIYAVRNDLVSRIDRLAPEEPRALGGGQSYRIGEYSDGNWQNGIAIGANAEQWSFALPQSLSDVLREGDKLMFSDGQERRVIKAEGTKVRTDPTLAVTQGDDGSGITFSPIDRDLLSGNLWARAYHRSQLGRIPSAWGRSSESLADSIRAAETPLKMLWASDAVAETGSHSHFSIVGPDPNWVFVLPKPVSPAEAGLLAMTISCQGTGAAPYVQVFWRSSTGAFSEEASLWFEASFAKNLVPLDSSPHWSVLPDIAEIRIDVAKREDCTSVSVEGVALSGRKSFTDQ